MRRSLLMLVRTGAMAVAIVVGGVAATVLAVSAAVAVTAAALLAFCVWLFDEAGEGRI